MDPLENALRDTLAARAADAPLTTDDLVRAVRDEREPGRRRPAGVTVGLVAVAVAAVVVGIVVGVRSPTPSTPELPDVAGATSATPELLVGTWRAEPTDGQPGGDLKLLRDGRVEMRWSCAEDPALQPARSNGYWAATSDGQVVVDFSSGNRACAVEAPHWLARTSSAAVVGEGRVVLVDGETPTAVLHRMPGGGTTPSTDAPSAAAGGLDADDEGWSAVTVDEVAGLRWVPVEAAGPAEPYLELGRDGSWTGSDGCNGFGGRWTTGTGFEVVAILGSEITLIGCDGQIDLWRWFVATRYAGLDADGVLVLLDVGGTELGRLHPLPADPTPTPTSMSSATELA